MCSSLCTAPNFALHAVYVEMIANALHADHRDQGEEAGAACAAEGCQDPDLDIKDASSWFGVRKLSVSCFVDACVLLFGA